MVELRPARAPFALEPKHCRAICREIGDRLGRDLATGVSPVPARLRQLLDQMADLDRSAPPGLLDL